MRYVVVELEGSISLDEIVTALDSLKCRQDMSPAATNSIVNDSVVEKTAETVVCPPKPRIRRTRVQIAKDKRRSKKLGEEPVSEDEIKAAMKIRFEHRRLNFELLSREMQITQYRAMKIVQELRERGVK